MTSDLKPLYIVGAGGFGGEVIWLAETINEKNKEWDIKGFVDDDSDLWNAVTDGYHVQGGMDVLEQTEEDIWCVIAIGNSKTRRKIAERLEKSSNIKYATLISLDAKICIACSVGEGSIICAGNIITVDVKIGRHNIINLDCTVGHDAILNDFVTLYPSVNISGYDKIGKATEIGTGTQIIQGVSVGTGTIVGAGSTVIRDIEDEVTAVGSPAKVIKHHSSGFKSGEYSAGSLIGTYKLSQRQNTNVFVWYRRAA